MAVPAAALKRPLPFRKPEPNAENRPNVTGVTGPYRPKFVGVTSRRDGPTAANPFEPTAGEAPARKDFRQMPGFKQAGYTARSMGLGVGELFAKLGGALLSGFGLEKLRPFKLATGRDLGEHFGSAATKVRLAGLVHRAAESENLHHLEQERRLDEAALFLNETFTATDGKLHHTFWDMRELQDEKFRHAMMEVMRRTENPNFVVKLNTLHNHDRTLSPGHYDVKAHRLDVFNMMGNSSLPMIPEGIVPALRYIPHEWHKLEPEEKAAAKEAMLKLATSTQVYDDASAEQAHAVAAHITSNAHQLNEEDRAWATHVIEFLLPLPESSMQHYSGLLNPPGKTIEEPESQPDVPATTEKKKAKKKPEPPDDEGGKPADPDDPTHKRFSTLEIPD